MALSITDQQLDQILSGFESVVTLRSASDEPPSRGDFTCVFPGSFNPRHIGHLEMAAYAERRFGKRVIYEISIQNVDKPDLTPDQIRRRLDQFDESETVSLTRAPMFSTKAELFSKAHFVIGADTIVRIGDATYYSDNLEVRDAAIDQLHIHGVRFLVFGRLIGDIYESARDLPLPERLRELCESVPERAFRRDISSTELRE